MTADVRTVASSSKTASFSTNSNGLLATRAQFKKRRIPGTCDIGKHKKIRCDSGQLPGNLCSNCAQLGLECTHKEVTKTLGSAKGYVGSLERRLEKMDGLLTKLLPGVHLDQELSKQPEHTSSPPPPLQQDEQADAWAILVA